MPEERYHDIRKISVDGDALALSAKTYYRNKYFSLFMNKRRFPELTREQDRFLKKKLWSNGSVAAFIIEDTKPDPTMQQLLTNSSPNTMLREAKLQPNGVLCFADYATTQYNVNDEPSVVNLVNRRGATFIPTEPQKVNEDVVIFYGHTSHKPISAMIYYIIDQIVEVKKTVNVNIKVHRLPRLVSVSPETEKRVKNIMEAIESGNPYIFLTSDDINAIKNVLETGATYIVDKLEAYVERLENEALTIMGFNNTPHEKAERLVTDEVNSNNQLIEECGDCFTDEIEESCKAVSEILGFKLTQEVKETKAEEPKEKEDGNDDAEN